MADFLVHQGIDSISANVDAVDEIRHVVARTEKKLMLDADREEIAEMEDRYLDDPSAGYESTQEPAWEIPPDKKKRHKMLQDEIQTLMEEIGLMAEQELITDDEMAQITQFDDIIDKAEQFRKFGRMFANCM